MPEHLPLNETPVVPGAVEGAPRSRQPGRMGPMRRSGPRGRRRLERLWHAWHLQVGGRVAGEAADRRGAGAQQGQSPKAAEELGSTAACSPRCGSTAWATERHVRDQDLHGRRHPRRPGHAASSSPWPRTTARTTSRGWIWPSDRRRARDGSPRSSTPLRLAAASTASARLRKTSGRGTHGRLRQGGQFSPGHASPASRSLTSQRWRWTSVPRVYRGGSIARPR